MKLFILSKRITKICNVIKKIKHDIYSKKTKRDENLKFLSLTISDYLSNIISKKYICGLPNSNKLIINRLLQDETNRDKNT